MNTIQTIANSLVEFWFYLVRFCLPRRSRIRFVILTYGRTGSEVLVDLLNKHPDITCKSELLNDMFGTKHFPLTYIEGRARWGWSKAWGFKLKGQHLVEHIAAGKQEADPATFIRRLHDRGWKIIHLTRKNVIQQAISIMIGEATGKWHTKQSERPPETHLDYTELMNVVEKIETSLEWEERMLQQFSHFTLSYEDDLAAPERQTESTARIFSFLGLSPRNVQTDFKRTGSSNLSKYLSNYSEIRDKLLGTKYESFIK